MSVMVQWEVEQVSQERAGDYQCTKCKLKAANSTGTASSVRTDEASLHQQQPNTLLAWHSAQTSHVLEASAKGC